MKTGLVLFEIWVESLHRNTAPVFRWRREAKVRSFLLDPLGCLLWRTFRSGLNFLGVYCIRSGSDDILWVSGGGDKFDISLRHCHKERWLWLWRALRDSNCISTIHNQNQSKSMTRPILARLDDLSAEIGVYPATCSRLSARFLRSMIPKHSHKISKVNPAYLKDY